MTMSHDIILNYHNIKINKIINKRYVRKLICDDDLQVTDTKLKELFSEKGLITDVQLKYTKDGKFRRFAFIGLKTEEQATAVKEYFDQTCIDTCKISIEQCASLGICEILIYNYIRNNDVYLIFTHIY